MTDYFFYQLDIFKDVHSLFPVDSLLSAASFHTWWVVSPDAVCLCACYTVTRSFQVPNPLTSKPYSLLFEHYCVLHTQFFFMNYKYSFSSQPFQNFTTDKQKCGSNTAISIGKLAATTIIIKIILVAFTS